MTTTTVSTAPAVRSGRAHKRARASDRVGALMNEDGRTVTERPGMLLRVLRRQTGLSVRETARRAGVGPRYLKRVERGEASPSAVWLGRIATVLADALVDGSRRTGYSSAVDDRHRALDD